MKLALLGGTGRIGGRVLSWALESGHDVQALARDPESLVATRGLTATAGDARDASAVAAVISGADAVLSALGPRGAKSPDLLAVAARNITAAMTEAGVRRLICVSAAGAFIQGDPDTGALVKAILPRIFATPFADTRQMEAVIRASDLDWTLVRATRLVNTARTGQYRVRPDYPPVGGGKISRADVADFIARVLTDGDWVRGAPALAY
ncbi:MAG TPA: NAD(P)H-binding protein [Streptosporangiaceae bacterium]|nr:NAD(P)H-binding protein [Streptosporangiaceae bacterium]